MFAASIRWNVSLWNVSVNVFLFWNLLCLSWTGWQRWDCWVRGNSVFQLTVISKRPQCTKFKGKRLVIDCIIRSLSSVSIIQLWKLTLYWYSCFAWQTVEAPSPAQLKPKEWWSLRMKVWNLLLCNLEWFNMTLEQVLKWNWNEIILTCKKYAVLWFDTCYGSEYWNETIFKYVLCMVFQEQVLKGDYFEIFVFWYMTWFSRSKYWKGTTGKYILKCLCFEIWYMTWFSSSKYWK